MKDVKIKAKTAAETGKTRGPEAVLRHAGLRPTRQRVALAQLLFDGMDKHVTAEELHRAACAVSGTALSLATVYNALHQFTAAGLLRQVTVDGTRVYFDTNTGSHHHFFDTATGALTDVEASAVKLARLPDAPKGRTVERVDVVIRLK
ncbi:MAG: transcriptional repressor [Alphaproteobacteria bacterium]|nr:transcriptional repressor [Alphaproteobacteria bacterium]